MTSKDKINVGFLEILNKYGDQGIPAEKIFIHPMLGRHNVSIKFKKMIFVGKFFLEIYSYS